MDNGVRIATINAVTPKDPSYDPNGGFISFPQKTSSDILVQFNTSLNEGYHLGGVKVGDNKYLWKTAPATFKESATNAGDAYFGEFPPDGAYDISNLVQWAGSNVYTLEKNIFWSYRGEFWQNSQTNKWNHLSDNGLLVSQFGITMPEAKAVESEAPAMGTGNLLSATIVKAGADYYIYHNDESVHSGMHRWKITGLNTIQEQVLPISFTNLTGGLMGAYFDGTDLNNFNRKATQVDTTLYVLAPPALIPNKNNFSARWTGYIKPDYSQNYNFYTNTSKGVRLWVDDKLLIDQWNNTILTEFTSGILKLKAGVKYSVRMETNGGTAALSWSAHSLSKQIIPSAKLYPSNINLYNDGIDLMEGLSFRSVLENGMYGWQRNPANEDQTAYDKYWHARTNIKSIDSKSPDLYISFRSSTGQAAVTRSLGGNIPCLNSWSVTGKVNYEWSVPTMDNESKNAGGFFEILDNNNKVISRITREMHYDGNGNPTSLLINGQLVAKDNNLGNLKKLTSKSQPFEIYSDSLGLVFKYAEFPPIKTKVFDVTSDWSQPTNIKFNFLGSTRNDDRNIDIKDLKFTYVLALIPMPIKDNNVIKEDSNKDSLNKNKIEISVYPNPFNQLLNIDFNNSDNQKNATITIYSIDSKAILEEIHPLTINSNTLTVDTGNLAQGVYCLIFKTDKSYKSQLIRK